MPSSWGQRWNRSGFSRPDPTGKFQNHRRLTGRSTGQKKIFAFFAKMIQFLDLFWLGFGLKDLF